MSESAESVAISVQLARIIEVLEDIFILQASIVQMNRKKLRAVVGIDMKRVNRISKYIKSPSNADNSVEATPSIRPRVQSKMKAKG
jgi:hypothetical protein